MLQNNASEAKLIVLSALLGQIPCETWSNFNAEELSLLYRIENLRVEPPKGV